MSEHVFWITSRAAGIAALLAASAAVALGLMMSSRLRKRPGDLRVVHEALSLATIVALAVHALSLLGDSYLKPSASPTSRSRSSSSYERLWTSVGIVGGWMFVILGLSYYFRGRIGPQRWRKLHRFTALAWVLGIGHALDDGHRRRARLVPARRRAGRAPRRRAARAPPHPGRAGDAMRFDCFGSRCGVWARRRRGRRRRPPPARGLARAASAASGPTASSRASTPTRARSSRERDDGAPARGDPRRRRRRTGGLVDGTLLGEIEAAGYRGDLARAAAAAARAARSRPPRRRRPRPTRAARWRELAVDGWRGAPPARASRFDSGGLAKGLFADLIAERLRGHAASPSTAAATCASAARAARGSRSPTRSAAPRAARVRARRRRPWPRAASAGAAGSTRDGRPAHHLLDPATGRPAFTGVVQATALAPDRARGRVAREGRGAQRPTRRRAGSRTAASSCSTTAPTSSPYPDRSRGGAHHEQARL